MSAQGTIRKFKSGDIVFHEGEPSNAAFIVVQGSVELTKNSQFGNVVLAKLKPGELFGEMGVIDGSPRSATARVVGNTTIKEIPAPLLLQGIQSDPNLSTKVMGKLVERLRAADDMLAKAGVSAASAKAATAPKNATTPPQKKKGFFSRLFSSNKGRNAPYEILIADLFEDEGGKITEQYFQFLSQQAQILGGGLVQIRRTSSPFPLTQFQDDPTTWGQMQTNASRWLTEEEADVLIWGRVEKKKTHLRFASLNPPKTDRAGTIQLCDSLDLPLGLDEASSAFFYGIAVAAIVPTTLEQRDGFEGLLGPALDAARPYAEKPPRDLDPDNLVRVSLALGNLLTTCGLHKRRKDRLQEAEQNYSKALRDIRRTKTPILTGLAYRHLGQAQAAWFEMGGETNLVEAAIESLREALQTFTQMAYPVEWAALQCQIGQLLYRRDQIKEDAGVSLRESIAAYRNALQVLSATATPRRWSEAKHHLARALQLLGSQTGDLDMIARAAEAGRECLVVRNRSEGPMFWAATQNNLGSALFMLVQKTRKPETAEAAVKAFSAALEVYEARKATKLAAVTKKNLMRAEELATDLMPLGSTLILEAPEETQFNADDFDKPPSTT